jgi:hypothetical protein
MRRYLLVAVALVLLYGCGGGVGGQLAGRNHVVIGHARV